MDGPHSLDHYLRIFAGRALPIQPTPSRSSLVERRQIETYFESMAPEWLARVRAHANQLLPLGGAVRLVALVPARFEQCRIAGFLNAFLADTRRLLIDVGPVVEVLILNNRRVGEHADDTVGHIQQWIQQYAPPFTVGVLEQEWPAGERCPLALSRKLLADTALYRILQRAKPSEPTYLLSEDADVESIQPDRAWRMLDYLDRNPQVDAVRGVQERSRRALRLNDLLLLERRTWYFAESLLSGHTMWPCAWSGASFYWNRVVTAGSNVCWSAEVYARIGGYSEDVELFEDMDIGQRISVLRGSWRRGAFVPDVSTVRRLGAREESNAGRAILGLADERHIYDHGDPAGSFYSREQEHALRTIAPETLLTRIASFDRLTRGNAWRFEMVLSSLALELRRILAKDPSRARMVLARTLRLTGLAPDEYRVDSDGRVNLLSIDVLASQLARCTSHTRPWGGCSP